MSIDNGQSKELDKVWDESKDSHSDQATPLGEPHPSECNDHVELGQLCKQVEDLRLRVTTLEKLVRNPFGFSKKSLFGFGETEIGMTEMTREIIGAGKSALAVVDHNLMTSKPRNEGIFRECQHGIVVLKRYNFAILQCLLMFMAIVGLITFGVLKFFDAHQSVNDLYKPYKVDGRDEYYRNEDLRYELPLHYFSFEIAVSETNFTVIYNQTYNQTCDTTLNACFFRYMEDFVNPAFALSPTDLPTRAPSSSPTFSPTTSPTDWFVTRPSPPSPTFTTDRIVSIVTDFTRDENIYNAPVSAHCFMTTSSNETVMTDTVGLRNLTLYLDEIGVSLQNESDVIDIFGMLMRLEFVDFSGYMSGKIMCDLYLEIERLEKALSGFASFDILFMVSREEFSSGTTGITEYFRSMKRVWRRHNGLIDQIYSYVFEENTFDGVSDFTAEVYLVDEYVDQDAMLNIEVYPYPTVMHYVSFHRYSYIDWLADVGGFYTLVIGIFYLLTTRVTKLANRRDLFHRKQGILPAFSLSHRNAEEISGLRSLVMAALEISEQDYFEIKEQRMSKNKE